MSHKLNAALKELDRRINEQLSSPKVKHNAKKKNLLKRVTRTRITIDSKGIRPPLSVDDIWSHCLRRFACTYSVSIQKPGEIDIRVRH